MANDPKNIRLGPCRVLWGGVDLGLTKGGVEVEVTTSTKEVMVDQFGETPVNEYITGRKLSVRCPFAETDLDTLYALMKDAGATLVDDGIKASGTIQVVANPVTNDTLTVNGTVFTFKTTGLTGVRDVKIGANAAATAQSLLAALQFSTDANVVKANYALDVAVNTTIVVTHAKTGTEGNTFTLARTGTALTVPATLTGGTASTRRRIEMSSGIGLSLLDKAKELVLRPVEKADNDYTEDFVVPLAGTSGAIQFAYQQNEERLFNLTFVGYPNPTTKVMFLYGDKRSA
jgi:hypothetical protein